MMISDLHDDLLNNILVRLPPECLGQLKIVSKSLNALISSQKFIKSHLNQSRIVQTPNVLVPEITEIKMVEFSITGDNMDLAEVDFDCKSKLIHCLPELLDDRVIIRIVGSSNGLLCLLLSPDHDTPHDSCWFFDHYNFALCNPLTKSTWDLPGNQWKRLFTRKSLYGFWYDDVNDDYKVVILNHISYNYEGGNHEYECEVYNLKTNSWSRVRSYLDSSYDQFQVPLDNADGAVLFNCALHWIIEYDYWKLFILAIDLRTYKPKILPLPKVVEEDNTLNLTVLNGSLVLSNGNYNNGDLYNLWVVQDYGSNDSWTRITIHKSSVRCSLTPLALLEDNNHKRILISYDKNDRMLELDDLDESDDVGSIRIRGPFFFHNAKQLQFVGSLVKPYPPSVGYEKISSDDRSEKKVAAGDSLIKEQIVNAPKYFKKFHIHVNGVSIDSQLHKHVRRKYYELCCIKKSFLHERLVPGVPSKLAARMIIEAVKIVDSIRSCKFTTTSRDEIEKWGKSLRSFELLGMNVGFLRDRICCLLRIAFDSEEAIEAKKYWKVKAKRAQIEYKIEHLEKEIEDLEKKFVELKEEGKKYGAEVDALKHKAESYERMFQVQIGKLL